MTQMESFLPCILWTGRELTESVGVRLPEWRCSRGRGLISIKRPQPREPEHFQPDRAVCKCPDALFHSMIDTTREQRVFGRRTFRPA
jgi:hypothetical protein